MVMEVEVSDRIQESVNSLVQLNVSSAENDLSELVRRADADG